MHAFSWTPLEATIFLREIRNTLRKETDCHASLAMTELSLFPLFMLVLLPSPTFREEQKRSLRQGKNPVADFVFHMDIIMDIIKETLIKSASKIFEFVFGVKKAQNRRYTLCVSRFCNTFHAKTDRKDATIHLFSVSLSKSLCL